MTDVSDLSALSLRAARRDELAWINARYREIGFRLSDYDRELIAIAERNGARIGIGRLVRVAPEVEELGGMYVLPAARGGGVATAIVRYLLAHRQAARLYCLPFAHLAHFYASFGFRPVDEGDAQEAAAVPVELREKLSWCGRSYDHPSRLFIFAGERIAVG